MEITQVIKYPILTEKSSKLIDNGIYTFAVDKKTNKAEVKKVVELIFDVKVAKVNILTIRKKPKKVGKFAGFKTGYKKAVVTLSSGIIKLFEDQDMKDLAPVEENTKVEENVISDAEKRAAEKIALKAKAVSEHQKSEPSGEVSESSQTTSPKQEDKEK